MISKSLRNEKYYSLSGVKKNLYDSSESGAYLRSIFEKHELNESLYSGFAVCVGDVILDFYPQTDLPRLLKAILNVDDTTVVSLTKDILEFLAPLRDEVATTNGNKSSLRETEHINMATDIAETEAALEKLPVVRTMAGDMYDLQSQAPHEETAYRSEQAHVLPPATASVLVAPSGTARWESEK